VKFATFTSIFREEILILDWLREFNSYSFQRSFALYFSSRSSVSFAFEIILKFNLRSTRHEGGHKRGFWIDRERLLFVSQCLLVHVSWLEFEETIRNEFVKFSKKRCAIDSLFS